MVIYKIKSFGIIFFMQKKTHLASLECIALIVTSLQCTINTILLHVNDLFLILYPFEHVFKKAKMRILKVFFFTFKYI